MSLQEMPYSVPYAISPSGVHGHGHVNGNDVEAYQPYTNPQSMGSYDWRLSDYQDSTVLNERRRAALDEVDKAHFSWFHAKVVAIVGAGFLTDAYDTFVIDMATTMLGLVYGDAKVDSQNHRTIMLSSRQELGLKVASPIGTFCGMLIFGYLGDRLGRKRVYGIELIIIIIAVFVQAMLGQAQAVSVISALVVWRFIMGIGIGGDYPTSAVIASEFAPVATRGRMITGVFATQGLGQFVGTMVSLITVYAYRNSLGEAVASDVESITKHIDQMWRILIGFGCVPGAFALLFRFTIPETPRFTMDIARNVNQASQDIDTFLTTGGYHIDPNAKVDHVQAPTASFADCCQYICVRQNWLILVGISYSWFALDIAFYGLSLNSTVILDGIFPTQSGSSIWDQLHNIAARNTIPICTGLIPGYVAAFFIVDRWGRRRLQFVGFSVLFVLLLIMGFAYKKFTQSGSDGSTSGPQRAFLFLYCLACFFLNCGPNTTTFLVSGESFPTRYRSTMNGVTAASWKLGAIISQIVVYALLRDSNDMSHRNGIRTILVVYAFFMLSGVGSTWLLPETMNRSLEDISNEDQTDFIAGPAQPSSK